MIDRCVRRALATQIPIRHLIDHGSNVQPNATIDAFLQKGHIELYTQGTRTVAKPGDRISIAGIQARIVGA